jgi:hypothetical protein
MSPTFFLTCTNHSARFFDAWSTSSCQRAATQ